jgi:hypothetical protein
MTVPEEAPHDIAEHHLAARTFSAITQASARVVFVTSARRGDGKTHLVNLLERRAAALLRERVRVLSASKWSPKERVSKASGVLSLLDGPALLEGPECMALPPELWSGVGGALLVVRGHGTTRADVRTCCERLEALGVPCLGVIWNERDHPPIVDLWRRLLGRFKRSSRPTRDTIPCPATEQAP